MIYRYTPAVAAVNTPLYGPAMARRLTAADWIDFALSTLAKEGFEALKADVLAQKLGVSRGSFYWHFADLGAFHSRVIDAWREIATEAIIAEIGRHPAPGDRLEALLRRAFGVGAVLEARMRIWADSNADAARALAEIDGRRLAYLEELVTEAGIGRPLAATRARLLYWSYLGAAMSRAVLSGEDLDRAVAELKRLGLG